MDMKTGSNFKTSKINVSPYPNAKKEFEHYPCFCEVAELILFFARLFAITPIVRLKNNTHSQMCKFKLSKYWKRYCCAVQVCFMIAAAIMHGIRLDCGPTISNTKFWYVMSIGYVINDLDAICCMIGGIVCGKKVCNILEQIATLTGSMQEMIALKSFMKKVILIVFLSYLISLCSYIYASVLRADADVTFFDNHCNIPDYPFAVVFRGFGLIFPVIEHLILTFLCVIIENKFKQLMEKTNFALGLSTNFTSSTGTMPNSLGQLNHDHKQIWFCLKEINTCFGLQLLISTTSMLFTTIYFLYRYSISSRETVFSNTDERLHYIVGLLYRIASLLHYMYLGRQITFWSQEPLRVLQNSDLLNLAYKIQQQVQTLLLQWSGKVGYLSALEVINMGPWLLAPIVGSVITYLLVALQFETTNGDAYNTTSMILEASF